MEQVVFLLRSRLHSLRRNHLAWHQVLQFYPAQPQPSLRAVALARWAFKTMASQHWVLWQLDRHRRLATLLLAVLLLRPLGL